MKRNLSKQRLIWKAEHDLGAVKKNRFDLCCVGLCERQGKTGPMNMGYVKGLGKNLNEIIFKKIFYLFIFRERGREGEREGEKHQCVVASCAPPTGDLVFNPGMCPDWESNQ